MKQVSELSLICTRCNTISNAELISEDGSITFKFDAKHVSVDHHVSTGALGFDPRCTHCPNPLYDEEVTQNDTHMIWVDRKLGPIIKSFWELGVKTQYSCEGHYFGESSLDSLDPGVGCTPYLIFSPDQSTKNKNLYRAAEWIGEDGIEYELSYYNYRTHKRVKCNLNTIKHSSVFEVCMSSDYWCEPYIKLTREMMQLDTTTTDEIYDSLKTAMLDAYDISMRARQEEFINYLHRLLREYKKITNYEED